MFAPKKCGQFSCVGQRFLDCIQECSKGSMKYSNRFLRTKSQATEPYVIPAGALIFRLYNLGMQFRFEEKLLVAYVSFLFVSASRQATESCLLERHCLNPYRIIFTDVYFVTATWECSRCAPRLHCILISLVCFIGDHHLYQEDFGVNSISRVMISSKIIILKNT